MTDVVQKLWGFCHTLRHDGIGYTEYVEQLTYLLFLKMADERGIELPKKCGWQHLRGQSGIELLDGYTDILRTLGRQPGLLGDIYSQSQSRFTKPTTLKQLIGRIDETEWIALGVDVKAAAYEGLLEKAASEGKKGAGQLFTPRVLIDSIVRCMKPDPRASSQFTICDPACGTGGFLVSAYEWLMSVTKQGGQLDRPGAKRLRSKTYFGQDIGETPRRLALMNLVLHGLEPQITLGDTIYEPAAAQKFDCILTNPPFGTKGANQAPDRDDFTVATSNKQLNFVQHVLTVLRIGGRAAVVLPDNCLFADQAGEVFKILTEDCRLHTVLRLPRGTFTPYSQGVKANVVFFTKGEPTDTVWIYDARTNVPGITKKDRPLAPAHFQEFERCFGADPNGLSKRKVTDSLAGGGDRWRKFSLKEIRDRDFKLDGLKWLKEESPDDSDELPEPEELVTDAIAELDGAVEELNAILVLLENGNGVMVASAKGQQMTIEGSDATELPKGWGSVRLREVVEINPPKPSPDALEPDEFVTFVPMPAVDAEQGAITNSRPRRFAEVRKGFTAFRDSDVIVAKITPCMENGKAAVARGLLNGLGFGSTEFHVLRSMGSVLPDFVYQFIRQESFRRAAESEMTGSVGQKRVPANFLAEAEIPLPPLAEQRRIVAKVEALLARVQSARARLARVPQLLKRFRQAILSAACRGQLTIDLTRSGNNANGRRTRTGGETESLFDVPGGWRWGALDSLCDNERGICYGVIKLGAPVAGGVPCLRTSDVKPLWIGTDAVKSISPSISDDFKRSVLRGGEVLVAVRGTLGGVAAVPDSMCGWNVSREVAVVPVVAASPKYVAIWIATETSQGWLRTCLQIA